MQKQTILHILSTILVIAVGLGFLTNEESENLTSLIMVGGLAIFNAGSLVLDVINRNKVKKIEPEQLAIMFHSFYEEMSSQFGYETREETRVFDETSPNGKLMIAVAKKIIEQIN